MINRPHASAALEQRTLLRREGPVIVLVGRRMAA